MSDIENEDINFADLVSNILLTTEAQENENNPNDEDHHDNNDNDVKEALGIDTNTKDTTNNNYEEWVDMIEGEPQQINDNKDKNISEEDDAFLTNAILNSLQSMTIEHPSMNQDYAKANEEKNQPNDNISMDDELLDAERLHYFNANNGDIINPQEVTNEPENDMDNMKLVDDILNYILGDDDKKGSKKKKTKSKKSKTVDSSKSSKHKKESKKKKKQASAEDDLQALINQVVSSTLEEHAKQVKKPKPKKKSSANDIPPHALNAQGGFTSTLQFPELTASSLSSKEQANKKAKSQKISQPQKQPVVEPQEPIKKPIYIPTDPKIRRKSDKKKKNKEALRKKKNDELDLQQIMKDAMSLAKIADAEKKAKEKERRDKEKENNKLKQREKVKEKAKEKVKEKAREKQEAKLAAKAMTLEKSQAKALVKSKKKEESKTKAENKVKTITKKPPVIELIQSPPVEKNITANKVKVTNVFKNSTIMKKSNGPALITSKTSSNAIIDKSKLAPKKITTEDRPFSKSDVEMLKVFVKPAVESKTSLEKKRKREARALKKLKKENKLKEEKAKLRKIKEEERQNKLKELEKKKQEKLAHKLQMREAKQQELALKNLEKENNRKMQEAKKKIISVESKKPAPTEASIKDGFKRLNIKSYKPNAKAGMSFVLSDGNKVLNSRYITLKPDKIIPNEALIKAGIWEKYKQARNNFLAELKEKGEDRPLKKKEEAKILKQVKKAHAKEVQDKKRQLAKEKKRLEKEENRKLRERETARRIEYMKSLDKKTKDSVSNKGKKKDASIKKSVEKQKSKAATEKSGEVDKKKSKSSTQSSYVPDNTAILGDKSAVISKNSLRLIPVVLRGPPFPYYLRLDDLGIPRLPLAKNNEKNSLKRMDDFEVKRKVDVYGRNLAAWERYKADHPDNHVEKYNEMIKNVQSNLLKYLGSLTSFDMDLGSFDKGYYINWSLQFEAHPPFAIPEIPVFTFGESIIETVKYGKVSIYWLYEQSDDTLEEIFSHEESTGLSIDALRLRNFNKELIQQRIERKPFEDKNKYFFQKSKFKDSGFKSDLYYSSANKNIFINVKSGSDQSHSGNIIKHFDTTSLVKRKRDENAIDSPNLKIIRLKEGKSNKRSKSHSSKPSKIKKVKRFQAPSSSIYKVPRHPDTLFDNINQKLFCILKTLDRAPSGYVKSYEEVAKLKDPSFKPIELRISDDLQHKVDNEINLLIRRFRKYYSRIDNETIQSYSTIIRSYTIFYLVWYTGLITDIGRHFGKIVKNYTKLFNVDKVVLGIRDILKDIDKRNLRKKVVPENSTINETNDLTSIFDFILGRVEIKLKMDFFTPFMSNRNQIAMADTIDSAGNVITREDTNKKRVNKYLLLSILFAIMEDCIQFVLSGLPEKVRDVIEDSNLEVQDAVSVISKEMADLVFSNPRSRKRLHIETSTDESILPPNQRFLEAGHNQALENNVVMLKKKRKLGHALPSLPPTPSKQDVANGAVSEDKQNKELEQGDNSKDTQKGSESIDKFKPGYDFGFGRVNEKTYEQYTDINPLVKSKIDVVWEMFFKYEFKIPPRTRMLRNRVMTKRIQLKVSTDVYKKFEQEYKTERMRRYRALKAEKEMEEIKDIKTYIAKSPLKSQWITKSQMDRVKCMKGMNGKLADNDLLNMLAFIQGNNLNLIKEILDDMERDCFEPAKKIKTEVVDNKPLTKESEVQTKKIKEESSENVDEPIKQKSAEVIDFTKDHDSSLKVDENVIRDVVEVMDGDSALPTSMTIEDKVHDASKDQKTANDLSVDPSLK
ncbi:hypothetical protein ACO0R3_000935 [Hanseniaspora guilliermondii]